MSLIPEPIPIDEESEENAEFHFLAQLRDIVSATRQLSFTSRDGAIQNYDKAGNFNAVWLAFTSNGVANTEDTVPHTLGRIPVAMLVSIPNKAAILYRGTTAWTETNIYLKTSVASTTWNIMVF